jgi:hypothetical protein
MDMTRDHVVVERCWGCNRVRIPKPWTPGTLALLRSEQRLVETEYLCGHDDCPAKAIAEGSRSKK